MNQQEAIAAKLATCTLGHGVGTVDTPCSIAAINLALTGRLTDEIPDCMSPVIGRWIISIQDEMPLERLNGTRWRALLPLAAGTGRDHEHARLDIILDWMWSTVLPQMQETADARGFGAAWRRMCAERTPEALRAAKAAAEEAAAKAAVEWAAAKAAEWAAKAAMVATEADYWDAVSPEALLERLIYVGVSESDHD